ncbi:acyloxyacyl hydrolase [Kamptonema cortianum]|nr:acyloxyacyl hydrolase [Geitlerinema splendidum]MDK3158636.1 acyloxyacyl hydrolase [Kamptonema cortianum]
MKQMYTLGLTLVSSLALANPVEINSTKSLTLSAQPENESYWYGSAGVVLGFSYIGSEEAREGIRLGVHFAKPEARLRWNGYKAQVVYSGYFMTTRAGGFDDVPINQLFTYGFSATARYFVPFLGMNGTFVDLGWGVAYSNRKTRDLDAQINSTPMIGIGAVVDIGETTLILSGKWFHMSNAGFSGSNQGMNSFIYTIGIKF